MLHKKSGTIFSAAMILMAFSFLSRLLGLFRDRILASKFGAGVELDMYYVAFRIPDFVFNLVVFGAVSSALLPVFAQYFNKDKKEGIEFAVLFLNTFFAISFVILAALFILTPQIINILAHGFSPAQKETTASLARIMYLSPLILTVSAAIGSILQSFRYFLAYSLAPVMYNLGIILGALFLTKDYGIKGVVYGVILGALLHLFIQLPVFIRSTKGLLQYRVSLNFKHQGIRDVFRLMLPRSLGLGALQLNLFAITALASGMSSGSISVFNFANNLQFILIGLFGISFAVAAFPSLSEAFVKQNLQEFKLQLKTSLQKIMFFVLPFSAIFFVLRAQIVRVVLGSGEFGWLETRLTAGALGVFTFGILFASVNLLLQRAFYALRNTKTPVLISFFSVFANIILSIVLIEVLQKSSFVSNFFVTFLSLEGIKDFSILAFPAALVLASFFEFLFLMIFLTRKIGYFGNTEIKIFFAKVFLATLFSVIACYTMLKIMSSVVTMERFYGVLLQGGAAGTAGLIVFLFAAKVAGILNYKILFDSIWKKKLKEESGISA